MTAVDLTATAFFALDDWSHGVLFEPGEPVWMALGRLGHYLSVLTQGAPAPEPRPGVTFCGPVVIGRDVIIEPGAYIAGPAVIEDGAQLRQGSYVRGNVLVGAGAVVGHCTELKNSVLLPAAAAPHFNYVGDSLLGRHSNLGAGTICSNFPLTGASVVVSCPDGRVDSGLRKLGAILGDGVQTGCNCVLNPGTLAGPGARLYPGVSCAGYFAAGATVKAPVTRAPRVAAMVEVAQ